MRSKLGFWLQLSGLAATGWLFWRPAMVRAWPHYSVAWVLLQAAGLAAAACLAAGLITLLLYYLLQHDPEYVVDGPLSTSTAAIWFAPAVILFAARSPAAVVAALVLVVNATTILHRQWRLNLLPAPVPAPSELFGSFQTPAPPFWRHLAPALAASFTAQAGVAAALLREPGIAGFALAASAATLTVFAQSSHAVEPRRPPRLPRSMVGLLLTLVLAIGLTVGGLMPSFGRRGFGFGDGGTAANEPGSGTAAPAAAAPRATPYGSAESGFFGVVLWPEVKPYTTLITPMPQAPGVGAAPPARPWSIPFSGEYWMFRWPFAHPPQNSFFQRGSPANLSFITTDHRPMQMEAHHRLDQPIATDCCRAVHVEVRNADRYPGTIALELFLVDGGGGRQSQMWAGRAPVLSRPQISGDSVIPVGETLEFPLPAAAPIQQFDEFKLVFSRDPRRMDKSAKVAIERLILIPRM
jgi:hypothetical protein